MADEVSAAATVMVERAGAERAGVERAGAERAGVSPGRTLRQD